MLLKKVNLYKHLNLNSLSTRSLAKNIIKFVNNEINSPFVLLSFKEIEFASRSFFNELNYLRKKESPKKIYYISMNKDLKNMEKISTGNRKTEVPENEITTVSIESFETV